MQRTMALAGVVIMAGLAASPARGAEKNMKACTYLTSAEVGAVAGTPVVGQPQESNTVVTEGLSKGQTMGMCVWDTGSKRSISIWVSPVPAGASRETLLAEMTKQTWFEPLKAQGWTTQTKNVGDSTCLIITPPPSQKNFPAELLQASASTSCHAGSKNLAIGVWFNGTSTAPLEKVKALLDKAVARLP